MRPPNNINTSRPIQISVDGRDSYIQVDTGGYNLTNDGIECNDPDTSIFIPWKYIQWIEQSTAVDTVFNRQTTHNNTGSSTNPTVTNPASIVDSRDDEIRLLERNNPFARIDMKLFKQCVNNHIIEHDENGWKIRISNQRIGHNENQAMSIIRSNPSLQVYLTQSLSTITLSDTDENHASTNANMNSVNNASMNQVNSDNKEQSDYTNDPWITIDDNTANDDGMQTLLTVDPQADNEDILDDYDDNMSYTPEMLIESYNDDTNSNNTSTISNGNGNGNGNDNTASDNTVSTMNNKTASTMRANANTTSSMNNKHTTRPSESEQSYAPAEPGFGFGLSTIPSTNNKNTTISATSANNASMGSHDSHEISDVNYKNNNLNRITVNNDVHMTAAHMPNAINNANNSRMSNNPATTHSNSNGMQANNNADTASMQSNSNIMNNTASQTASYVNNDNMQYSDYYNDNNASSNTESSPIHSSRKKKKPVKHHLTDYEVDDSSNTDNATTADENGCDWVVLMVALGYAGTIVSRWRSRSEAEADRDARIENNHVSSSMIPLNYMVFKANGNRLYDRKYIPRDKNGIPLKGYNEYGEYVAGLPGYEF